MSVLVMDLAEEETLHIFKNLNIAISLLILIIFTFRQDYSKAVFSSKQGSPRVKSWEVAE